MLRTARLVTRVSPRTFLIQAKNYNTQTNSTGVTPSSPKVEFHEASSTTQKKLILVTTRDQIHEQEIEKELGVVVGSSVKSRAIIYDLYLKVRAIFGGELRQYTELLSSASGEATRRMIQEAQFIDADAVVRTRYQMSSTSDAVAGAVCYVLSSVIFIFS